MESQELQKPMTLARRRLLRIAAYVPPALVSVALPQTAQAGSPVGETGGSSSSTTR